MSQQSRRPSLLNRNARVLLCLVSVHGVIGKLTGFAVVAGAIAAKGLTLAELLFRAAIALMAVGSALVICGWRARLGVVLLLVLLIPATLIVHGDVSDKMERIQLFKNLAIIGGLLLVADQNSNSCRGDFPRTEKLPSPLRRYSKRGDTTRAYGPLLGNCGDVQGVAGS
jgi:putative oxidoreductase